MKIPLDFHYRIMVEDLDTGKREWFLVPRNTKTAVPAPPELASELNAVIPVDHSEQPMDSPLLDLSNYHPMPGEVPTIDPPPASAPEVVQVSAQQAPVAEPGLVPGIVAGPGGAKDLFGAEEG